MPFAGVLGRVCTHPCEHECERSKVEESISIRNLHRFVADENIKKNHNAPKVFERSKNTSVAIIGSGPAGLSCAYELIQRGYGVTVFESAEKPGGLLRYGIPDYRLPTKVLDDEIEYIRALGVKIKCNTPITDAKALLNKEYNAVFLATGAAHSQKLGLAKEEIEGIIHALDFLNAVNKGSDIGIGQCVAVIGGGNAAVDAARVAKRLGAKEVSLVYRRGREEMPAISSEIVAAEEEGINLQLLTAPREILSSNGRLYGIKCIRTELGEEDEGGRRRPVPVQGSEFDINIDNVIIAVGQTVDREGINEIFEFNTKSTINVDPETLTTGIEGIFAGGDVVSGPSDVVSAVAAGQEAAISIELYLEGIDLKEGRPKPLKKVEEIPTQGVIEEARQRNSELPAEQRINFKEVERTFTKEPAETEAKRCLNCSVYAEKGEEVIEARGIGLKISPGAYVHCLPLEAGFVGADNVGVLIAEEPYKQDKIELIIDIGTNGELVLGNRHKLVSASCATGPALEGAEIKYGMRAAPGAIEKIAINPETKEVRFKVIEQEGWNDETENIGAKGICGSGIVDIMPQLFLAGIIEKTGRFIKDLETPRYRVTEEGAEFVIAWASETSIGEDIVICQDDLRAIQLAKGAMYAGAKIMMRTYGAEKLDKVILAGAFGSYIDKTSAALLGLFPDCNPENVYAVGNAAGDGARMALLNTDKRIEANKWARKVEYLELTLEKDFDKIFAQAMWLPHMKDKFPHIESLLPKLESKGG
jgi:NADPH-dependent glutamate synthase beta subunit-like oxidoreductase